MNIDPLKAPLSLVASKVDREVDTSGGLNVLDGSTPLLQREGHTDTDSGYQTPVSVSDDLDASGNGNSSIGALPPKSIETLLDDVDASMLPIHRLGALVQTTASATDTVNSCRRQMPANRTCWRHRA